MSRTIKTMPPAIIARDLHAITPNHKHDHGPCDLPANPRWDQIGWVTRATRCQWTYSDAFWFTRQFCGCRMCTDFDGRRAERRRDRHQAKAEARRIRKYGED